LPERVSALAGWSVVTYTIPGFMRSSIAACTSGGGVIRSTTDVLGLFAPFLPVLKPLACQVKPSSSLGVDFLVGSAPLVGDLLDVVFKANRKNARLLEARLSKQAKGTPEILPPRRRRPRA
jgi:hypothetical protein